MKFFKDGITAGGNIARDRYDQYNSCTERIHLHESFTGIIKPYCYKLFEIWRNGKIPKSCPIFEKKKNSSKFI